MSRCEAYSSTVSRTSSNGMPLTSISLPISSATCRFPMLASRTRMMSTCCRVKRPASQRSKKSCSSSSTSSSRSIFSISPLFRAESASRTAFAYSSWASSNLSNFSKLFSVNLLSTRATAVPVQYRHKDWMIDETCSSLSRTAARPFVVRPFLMNIEKSTGSPSFSTKIWQLSAQCRREWSQSRSARFAANLRSRIIRIMSSTPWAFPKSTWCAGINIREHKQSNIFCTNSDSSLSAGSFFR
mmetsp:Transcript_101435/g.176073  ORF Transcript_101435/g.176073 Transcript_101435/m.176073 type:complete len:242 (-) Transcript_101435:809-1534(-)